MFWEFVKMLDNDDMTAVYDINKDYRIVKFKGSKCSLFFKNRYNQLLASLEGCQDVFANIVIAEGQKLTDMEKGYLLSFIRGRKYSISKEVADVLGVSIVRYGDGREEYLSEKQLKRRIEKGIDFAKIYIGKLGASVIKIADDSKDCSYIFGRASVGKIVVGKNCSVNIDLRDNLFIQTVSIDEQFSGTVNLSRSTIESLFIKDNCRCDLTVTDSKKCFNLTIGDIYSGNLNITNSCIYALEVGYYSYADLMLSNNIVKKEIVVGDSFRGGLYINNQNVSAIKIGNDCKGWLKVNNQSPNIGVKKLIIGDDFGGTLNLSGDDSIEVVNVGNKNSGKIDASYSELKKVVVGKYFSGTIDLNGSVVESISIDYGAGGNLIVTNCKNLTFLQASKNNSLKIDSNGQITEKDSFDEWVFYDLEQNLVPGFKMPFYKKLYHSWQNKFR